jgi:hypothetical protein
LWAEKSARGIVTSKVTHASTAEEIEFAGNQLDSGATISANGFDPQQLVLDPTADAIELARLQLALEDRRRRLAGLEEERDSLELTLTRFAAQVKERIGDYKDEIRLLRLKLEELRQRVQRLRIDPNAAPSDIEREIAEELAAQNGAHAGSEFVAGPNGRHDRNLPARPPKSIETEAEVLRLYRELAKRHHPDLARTSAERDRRSDLMLRINIAYRDRDLATLQSIFLEVQLDSPLPPEELCRQRLSWTRHEIARLEREIASVTMRIKALKETETYALWQSEEADLHALDDLETRTRQRLLRERQRVEEATAQYNRMAARRSVLQRRAAHRLSADHPTAASD